VNTTASGTGVGVIVGAYGSGVNVGVGVGGCIGVGIGDGGDGIGDGVIGGGVNVGSTAVGGVGDGLNRPLTDEVCVKIGFGAANTCIDEFDTVVKVSVFSIGRASNSIGTPLTVLAIHRYAPLKHATKKNAKIAAVIILLFISFTNPFCTQPNNDFSFIFCSHYLSIRCFVQKKWGLVVF